MKSWLALALSLFLLTACTPSEFNSAYRERTQALEAARAADAMALVTVGDSFPSYELAGDMYTDTRVAVIRGSNLTAGANITLQRQGGSITDPVTGVFRIMHVDYSYGFPAKGGQVFLLLRRVGQKYAIIDAMALEGGRPISNRSANQVYLSYLSALK